MIPRRKFNGAKHSTEATGVQETGYRTQELGNRIQDTGVRNINLIICFLSPVS
jgi:hypothetical protein